MGDSNQEINASATKNSPQGHDKGSIIPTKQNGIFRPCIQKDSQQWSSGKISVCESQVRDVFTNQDQALSKDFKVHMR